MDADSNNLRVASFAAYLNNSEESFGAKINESPQYSPPPAPLPPPPAPAATDSSPEILRPKPEESEISVFSAEMYFNMKVDDTSPRILDYNALKQSHKKKDQVDLRQTKPKGGQGPRSATGTTPSICSETSWNSQSTLFPSFMRNNSSQSKQKKSNDKWFFPVLSCRGSCSDRKFKNTSYIDPNVMYNAQIDQNAIMSSSKRQSRQRFLAKDEVPCPSFDRISIGSGREGLLTVPVMNSSGSLKKKNKEEEEPRYSLEVFGSNEMKKGDITKNLERKLSMLTWDAIPNGSSIKASSASSLMHEEVASDASSDLFEIENISGNGGQALFDRQASDGMSSCVTPYAPSETSIEWSVVTASAADFSVASDYDAIPPASPLLVGNKKGKPFIDKGKSSSGGGLLGCKSHKAVEVAETAYNHRSDSNVKSKFQRSVTISTARNKPQAHPDNIK